MSSFGWKRPTKIVIKGTILMLSCFQFLELATLPGTKRLEFKIIFRLTLHTVLSLKPFVWCKHLGDLIFLWKASSFTTKSVALFINKMLVTKLIFHAEVYTPFTNKLSFDDFWDVTTCYYLSQIQWPSGLRPQKTEPEGRFPFVRTYLCQGLGSVSQTLNVGV